MSTNATIAVTNGVMCKAVYLHWDGYLSWAGVMLHDYYATPEKVEQLISLGALSSIRERLEPAFGEYHTFENPMEDVTIAYHRDRDEPLEIHTFPDLSLMGDKIFIKRLAQISDGNYVYLFDTRKGQWFVSVTGYFLDDEKAAVPDAKPFVLYPLKAWFKEAEAK